VYNADGNKEKLSKSFGGSWVTSLLDSEDLKVMSTDRDENAMDDFPHIDFSRTFIARENFYFYCFHLASRKGIAYSKVVEICGKRPSRQRFRKDYYEEKEG
jgi:hypothetical protein